MKCEIIYIDDDIVKVKLPVEFVNQNDLMNLHLVFVSGDNKILGEIVSIDFDVISVNLIGEFVNGTFVTGIVKKPKFNASIRTISKSELDILASTNDSKSFLLGGIPQYGGYPYRVNIDELFGNHFAVFGNTGSGKSYGVSRIFQSLFYDTRNLMVNSKLLIFDVHGEYKKAFSGMRKFNPTVICKDYDEKRKLKIPVWLLDVYDIALLLGASNQEQISLLEKTMKLVKVFSINDEKVNKYKNHIISKAILSVMYSNKTNIQIRNEVFEILNMCNTKDISLNTIIKGLGYERNLKKCFEIARNGSFAEELLIISFLETFIDDELELNMEEQTCTYNLKTVEEALSFTVISENILNTKLYDSASLLQVRLRNILTSESRKIFEYNEMIDLNSYLDKLFKLESDEKAQIVLFNMETYEDKIGKFIVKLFSKFVFEYSKSLTSRASIPFHIVLEEAHRFITNDSDEEILNYNIFSRIAKEGRKYGVLLVIITQRPTELVENVISQCCNFILFRINHPKDLEYLKATIPNTDSSVIEKQKCIQPGICIGFGRAFKIPIMVKLDIPNPTPLSDNADVFKIWKG